MSWLWVLLIIPAIPVMAVGSIGLGLMIVLALVWLRG